MMKLRISKFENELAYARLLRAVYHRARLDLLESVITSNIGRETEVRRFYKNDPYLLTPEEGEDIINTVISDIREANEYIQHFIEMHENKAKIPSSIDPDAIFYLVKYKYPKLNTRTKNVHKPYIYWREKVWKK